MFDEYYLENPSENDYLYEKLLIEAEKAEKEWFWYKEELKFEKEKKAATIKIKAEHDKDRIECAPVSGID